jgi:hypothetical protein
MVVNDNRNTKEVVSNFDFTFCQIWYNGTAIVSSYFKSIEAKSGKLNSKYLCQVAQNNQHTMKRIQKYGQRGFSIEIGQLTADAFKQTNNQSYSALHWCYQQIMNYLRKVLVEYLDSKDKFRAYFLVGSEDNLPELLMTEIVACVYYNVIKHMPDKCKNDFKSFCIIKNIPEVDEQFFKDLEEKKNERFIPKQTIEFYLNKKQGKTKEKQDCEEKTNDTNQQTASQ